MTGEEAKDGEYSITETVPRAKSPAIVSGDLQALPTMALSYTQDAMSSEADEQDADVSTLLSEVLDPDNDITSGNGDTDARTDNIRDRDDWWTLADPQVQDEDDVDSFLNECKHYFILSRSGKPIYTMHGTDEIVSGYMAIVQTIVSFFEDGDEGEQLRSFTAGRALFVVAIEDPLILIAVDKLGQSEAQLRAQLNVLYAQILSTLTKSQISKAFQARSNFDLRHLLGGTEVFLNALTKEMSEGSPSILLGALECLRIRKTLRNKINNTLLDCRTPNLLYGMIIADSRLVSVIRPRRHSLHPPDLYLVFSMLFNTTAFRDGGEHWAPICLPRFNSFGFLYAYIHFFADDIALVLISPDKNAFFEMRQAKDNLMAQLDKQDLVEPVKHALVKGRFRSVDIPAPLIRHFLYKSKANVQFVMPSYETHFYDRHSRLRLMYLYHQLHRNVHSRPLAGGGSLKVFHTVRQNATALAWLTPSFELYCVTGAPTTKDAISQSVKQVVNWIKQQEERLFILGGGVF